MLIHQPWVHFAPDMITEWEQCLDEGRDVASLKALCEEIENKIRDCVKKLKDEKAGVKPDEKEPEIFVPTPVKRSPSSVRARIDIAVDDDD
jgi:hypothetical protein